jgi:TPP-dependent 2-oxoacid decarboxylase
LGWKLLRAAFPLANDRQRTQRRLRGGRICPRQGPERNHYNVRYQHFVTVLNLLGVGELSALNGIAGAYSEYVPTVHIVGCPSTSLQNAEALLHHTLGNGDFHVFRDMSRAISHRQLYLDDPVNAPAEIDRLLIGAYLTARPVYVMIPTDMVPREVSGTVQLSSVLNARSKPAIGSRLTSTRQ